MFSVGFTGHRWERNTAGQVMGPLKTEDLVTQPPAAPSSLLPQHPNTRPASYLLFEIRTKTRRGRGICPHPTPCPPAVGADVTPTVLQHPAWLLQSIRHTRASFQCLEPVLNDTDALYSCRACQHLVYCKKTWTTVGEHMDACRISTYNSKKSIFADV